MTSPQPFYNLIGNFTYSAHPRGFRCRSGSAAMLNEYFYPSVGLVQHLPVGNLAKVSVDALPSLFPQINHNSHWQPLTVEFLRKSQLSGGLFVSLPKRISQG